MSAATSPRDPLNGEVLAAIRRAPLAGRTRTVRVSEGATLAEIARANFPEPFLRQHVVAMIDGVEVPVEAWKYIAPRAGQAVGLYVRPGNSGNGGSNILRTILAIIVVVIASWISEGGWTPEALEWAGPFIAAGFVVVANLAINALIPLKPDAPQESTSSSPVKSITGARNSFDAYSPVGVYLGRNRVMPKLMGRPVQETIGEDVFLRIPFCWGPAPVVLSELKIGETALSEFTDVQLEHRLTADAPAHTLYAGDPDQEAVGASITQTFQTRTTVTGVDEIEVVIGFRAGLGRIDDKGRKVSVSVTLEIEYRPHGSSDAWVSFLPDVSQSNQASASAGAPYRPGYFDSETTLDNYTGYLSAIDGVAVSPVTYARADPGRGFQSRLAFAVPRHQFDVRIRRTNAETAEGNFIDACWWELLGSRKSYVDPFPVRALATTVLRIKASDQLSGVIDTFNAIVEPQIPTFNSASLADPDIATAASFTGAAASRNPANLAIWSVRGPMAALPKADHEIDWPAWAEFAAWCVAEGLHYDEPIENAVTRGEMLNRICAAGFGKPTRINGRLSVVIDRPRDGEAPSQVFTPRNVSGFKWTKTFPPKVHAARIAFANEANGWQADEVVLFLDGFDESNATIYETLPLAGKTNADEVRQVGRQFINNALTQTETYSFSMDAEALTCTLGAYVLAQHDVMAVGLGAARVKTLIHATAPHAAQIAGFILDVGVETPDGPTLGARWRTIVDDSGLAHFEAGAEYAVSRDPDDARAFSFTATLLDADDAPKVGDMLMIGETDQVSLECLVKTLEPDTGGRANVTLIDYSGERFTPDGITLPPHDPKTTIPVSARPATPVLLSAIGRNTELVVSFIEPPSPRGVRITSFEAAVRESGTAADSWGKLPDLRPSERVVIAPAGDPGAKYDVRIVAVALDNGGLEVRSDPLIVAEIDADDAPAVVASPTATFIVRESPLGARQLILVATWTKNEDPDIVDTRIEIPNPDVSGAWSAIGSGRAALGTLEVHGLQVGREYTFGFVNVTRRGAVSTRVVLSPIDAPDDLTAVYAVQPAPGSPLETALNANAAIVADDILRRIAFEAAFLANSFIGGETIGSVATEARDRSDAAAADIALLGVRNTGGTAWLLDADSVTVPAGDGSGSSAVSLRALRTEHDQTHADVVFLIQSVGGAVAQATLTLDVDGYIVGFKIDDGGTPDNSDFIIYAPVFKIVDAGNGLTTPRDLITVASGLVKMADVEIDTLKVNIVDTQHLIDESVSDQLVVTQTTGATVPGSTSAVEVHSSSFTSISSVLEIAVFLQLQRNGGGRITLTCVLKMDGTTVETRVNSSINPNFANTPFDHSLDFIIESVSAGAHTWSLEVAVEDGNGGVSGYTSPKCRFHYKEMKK